jgi:hypothetical protein
MLLLTACFESAERGPYLQNASSTSMVIRWRDGVTDLSRVNYGTQAGVLMQVAETTATTDDHVVLLENLTPETVYYYKVNGANKGEFSFKTPPVEGVARPTRVWILGDSGRANEDAMQVRDAFYEFNGGKTTDLVLMLGDNAYKEGSDHDYQEGLFDMYGQTLHYTPLYPSIGNHDIIADGPSTYFSIFTLPIDGKTGGVPSENEAYYSFNYSNIHFVTLDSVLSNRSPDGTMYRWLAADLAANTQDWTVVFFHHPPYSRGKHNSDSAGLAMADMRKNFTGLFEEFGVDLVFSGHNHNYERSFLIRGHRGKSNSFVEAMKTDSGDGRKDGDGAYEIPANKTNHGIVYTVAGSSSRARSLERSKGVLLNHPVHYLSMRELGSVVLDFNGDVVDFNFVSPNPEAIDYFTVLRRK